MKGSIWKIIILTEIILFFCIFGKIPVLAMSMEEYDLESADGYVDEDSWNLDFSSIAESLYESDFDFGNTFVNEMMEFFLLEIRNAVKIVFMALGMIVAGAVFQNMTGILKDTTVTKTGSFITYIAVMTVLFLAFEEGAKIAGQTAGKVMDFLYALIPTYFCAVTFTKGTLSGSVMYQWTGLCISLVQMAVNQILLPLVNYFVIFSVINHASEDKKFSSMCSLIKKMILYVNRTIMGIVVGMTTVKSLTVPLSDSLKNTFLKKTIAMIPGIGNGVENVAETIAGTGNLIKNTIGAAGMIVVVLIIAIPFLKLLSMNLMIRFLGAVTEPVAAPNVVCGINAISDGIGILQYIICTSSMVLMIIIAMICVATGG